MFLLSQLWEIINDYYIISRKGAILMARTQTMDGNQAAAYASYAFTEV